jgi:hypothetical protein
MAWTIKSDDDPVRLTPSNVKGFLSEVGQVAEPYYGLLSDADLRLTAERYGSWQGYWANYLRAAPRVEELTV